ncbi:hypothetical protein MKX01_011623 [Papaver californicum]|nr:hypothetical protein MKX01_011623 [Papaver californicum]
MATTAAVASSSSVTEEELTLTVKWSGKEYTVRVCGDDSVGELKRRICQVTNVLPKRQKLLYCKLSGPKSNCSGWTRPSIKDQIYLHEFLSAVYAEYDIIIWSATSMKWVELKMQQLGVLSNPNYKITALLDHMAMITVQSDSRGIFDCKPLGLIWGQFPEFYSSKNTIMFDDLRRNFVMNPQDGLTIRPFRKAHANRDTDQELVNLIQYLLAIADLKDLSKLDPRHWESYTEETAKRRRHN